MKTLIEVIGSRLEVGSNLEVATDMAACCVRWACHFCKQNGSLDASMLFSVKQWQEKLDALIAEHRHESIAILGDHAVKIAGRLYPWIEEEYK